MAYRAIGIDYDGATLRVVALQVERGTPRILRHAATPWDGAEPLPDALRRTGVIPTVGDRVATALPLAVGYTRTLRFPFGDRRKVAAAVPLDLDAQLPVAVEECIVDQLDAQLDDNGATVVAAAAPMAAVAATVAPFDRAGIPLQTVDLLPAILASGLGRLYGDGHALLLRGPWGVLLRHEAGRLCDLRLVALSSGDAAEDARSLSAAWRTFRRSSGATLLRVIAPHERGELIKALGSLDPETSLLEPVSTDTPLPPEFLPALFLAQRPLAPHGDGFNFRRGAFARHGEWTALRSRMILVAALAGAALSILIVSCALRWWGKSQVADALKGDLVKIYRQSVPGDGTVVDVPQQLRARLAEITRNSRPGGRHPALSPLLVLREVSAITPPELRFTLREWDHTAEEVRLAGTLPAFDDVDRLTSALSRSPLFKSVRVIDSKSSADRSRIDLQLLIALRAAEELP